MLVVTPVLLCCAGVPLAHLLKHRAEMIMMQGPHLFSFLDFSDGVPWLMMRTFKKAVGDGEFIMKKVCEGIERVLCVALNMVELQAAMVEGVLDMNYITLTSSVEDDGEACEL
jgi:hypothetical protein